MPLVVPASGGGNLGGFNTNGYVVSGGPMDISSVMGVGPGARPTGIIVIDEGRTLLIANETHIFKFFNTTDNIADAVYSGENVDILGTYGFRLDNIIADRSKTKFYVIVDQVGPTPLRQFQTSQPGDLTTFVDTGNTFMSTIIESPAIAVGNVTDQLAPDRVILYNLLGSQVTGYDMVGGDISTMTAQFVSGVAFTTSVRSSAMFSGDGRRVFVNSNNPAFVDIYACNTPYHPVDNIIGNFRISTYLSAAFVLAFTENGQEMYGAGDLGQLAKFITL